jgi:biopolymer transport protein ExbB
MPAITFHFLNHNPLNWLILGIAFIGGTLFLERLFFLHKGQIRATSFITGIKNLLKKDRLIEAITVCEETPGPIAHVIKIALLNHAHPESYLRTEIEKTALLQIPPLEKRLHSLLLIAQITPLIGLLSLLFHFLNGFLLLQQQGPYADNTLFTNHVIHGLTDLILGLLISILVYMGYHFLKGRLRAISYDIEWSGSDILQFLLNQPLSHKQPTILEADTHE